MPRTSPRLIVVAGLPYSGKSRYIDDRLRVAQEFPKAVVCADDIRLALHGQRYAPTSEPFVWAIAEVMARALLARHGTVYIDATNTTEKRRATWIKLARELEVRCELHVMLTDGPTCVGRALQAGDGAIEAVIARMRDAWEEPGDEWEYVTGTSAALGCRVYDLFPEEPPA